MKDWPKPKSICNIQIFLGFFNFYWQFIQSFCKKTGLLISMLKTIESPNKPSPSRNNGIKSASSRNNNSKPVFGRNNGNGEVVKFGGMGYTKKSEKLKGQKLAKSQKLSKSGKSKGEKSKKLSKSRNLSNFDITKAGPMFLNPDARTTFNRLQLAFTKALIL